jgi:RHS repeat-associated protein
LQKTTYSDTLELDDDPIVPGTYEGDVIISSGRVSSGSTVTFTAEESITLNPGFEAEAGADFTAQIQAVSAPTAITRDYLGEIEYYNGQLEAIYHEEGRAIPNGSTYEYHYAIRDHLGSTQVLFKMMSGTATIIQENHFYPFGMEMDGVYVAGNNKYRFNGKELNEDFGLEWYDFGARWFDPAIGRWNAVDPLAENYFPLSTYNYVANNPIILIDPNGMEIINGAELKRKEAEREFNTISTIVEGMEEKYGTKKSDFKDKKSYKTYKRAKRQRNKAKRNLRNWTITAETTADLISDFQSESPNMFNEINNLTNEYGEEVDVFILTVSNVEGPNDGANIHGFRQEGEKIRPISEFSDNSIEVQISSSPSGKRTQLDVLRHEMGHTSYQGQNTKAYYNYLKANKLLGRRYDGHRSDDPSGKRAAKYGKLKDLE